MAKTLGLIGGTGPESTIEYYRLLIAKYREQADGNAPPLLINSVNLKQLIEWMNAGELSKVAEYVSDAIESLHRAGADLAAFGEHLRAQCADEHTQRVDRLP